MLSIVDVAVIKAGCLYQIYIATGIVTGNTYTYHRNHLLSSVHILQEVNIQMVEYDSRLSLFILIVELLMSKCPAILLRHIYLVILLYQCISCSSSL